jgi:hypothetical protein
MQLHLTHTYINTQPVPYITALTEIKAGARLVGAPATLII